MKFFKSVKGFTKGLAKGLRKGMDIGEKIVNAADKATGGQLRSMLGSYTGGKSEALLMGYKGAKPLLNKGIDVVEGKKNIKQALEGTKYYDKYNKGIEHLKKAEKVANETGMVDKARSFELGRRVLNSGARIKPMLGV